MAEGKNVNQNENTGRYKNKPVSIIRWSSSSRQLIEQHNMPESAPANDEIIDLVDEDDFIRYSCKQCGKTYQRLVPFMRHTVCIDPKKTIKKPIVKILSKDIQLKYKRTQKQYAEMEIESRELAAINICFCCEETLLEAHAGHIRCFYCPKSFKSEKNLERHIVLLHAPCELYPCTVCNATCPTPGILKLHLDAHKLVCKKCGKEFFTKRNLYRHKTFTSCNPKKLPKNLVCLVCRKKFNSLDKLKSHSRIHVGKNSKRKDYKCLYCAKSFLRPASLNIHIRTHTRERPCECDLCDKSFSCNSALIKHRRQHTGEKPFQCGLCERKFAVKEVLNRHMKIHTGDKPHKCEYCGKGFIQGRDLKAHLFYHTGEHGFKCSNCDAIFNRKYLLTKHAESECTNPQTTNKKAFFFKFVNMRNLKTCKRKPQSNRTECSICNKTFNTKVKYENHLKTIHKIVYAIRKNLKQILKKKEESESYTSIISISEDDDSNEVEVISDEHKTDE